MVRDPRATDGPDPDLEDVVGALDDPDCRTIISHLEEPMTASEISDASDVPLSTTYRKLDRLSDASLLAEGTEIRGDGRHATLYEVDFEEVSIALTEDQEFEFGIVRPTQSGEERIATLWSEVRREV